MQFQHIATLYVIVVCAALQQHHAVGAPALQLCSHNAPSRCHIVFRHLYVTQSMNLKSRIQVVEKLYRLKWGKLDGLGALVISPTRELAIQIFDELRKVGAKHDLSAGLLIGGKSVKEEQGRVNGALPTLTRQLSKGQENRSREVNQPT